MVPTARKRRDPEDEPGPPARDGDGTDGPTPRDGATSDAEPSSSDHGGSPQRHADDADPQRPTPLEAWMGRGPPADRLWWASKRWVAALVIALFPFLFILDDGTSLGFSPVLPGLVLFVVLILGLPFLVMELWSRRLHSQDTEGQDRTADRARRSAKFGLGISVAWFLLWLALGA